MAVAESMINNVRNTKVTDYLKKKGVTATQDEKGMLLHLWLEKLLNEERITPAELNQCLFQELMYGKRRFIRFYELRNIRKIKREDDWQQFLQEFQCSGMNFNRILETSLSDDRKLKVSAMSTSVLNGSIQTVDILFLFNMKIRDRKTEGEANCYSYLPVTFDFCNKALTIKVWNREEGLEDNTPLDQILYVYAKLVRHLAFDVKEITVNPQVVLYRMSKALFDDFFIQLPNIDEIVEKRASLQNIINQFLANVTLQNVEEADGKLIMNPEVMNMEEEMYKLLQQVALFDYLKDNNITTLLLNTDKYVSRIRFNDRDNLTASLTSEKGVRCIFDAKTFMCVRNSLDLVESIVALVVSFVKDKGLLSVKYDASDRQYLNIHILQERYYSEEDYRKIWELYRTYESEDNADAGAVRFTDDAAAM